MFNWTGSCKFKIFIERKSQKLLENAYFHVIFVIFGNRSYRWVADYNRPINRSIFRRLIGIGRTLACNAK